LVHCVQVISPQIDDVSDIRFAQSEANLPGALTKLAKAFTKSRFNDASSYLTRQDEECVMCQYFVQRLQGSMLQYAFQFHSALTKSTDPPFTSFLEIDEEVDEIAEDTQGSTKKDKKTDWFLAFQQARNTLADAFKDDETLPEPVLTDDTFTVPMSKPQHKQEVQKAVDQQRHRQPEIRFVAKPQTKKSDQTDSKKTKMVGVSASRRQRVIDAKMSTPVTMRFLSPGGEFVEMETTLYKDFVSICGDQPLAYGKYCDNILEQFPFVVQGLDSRDTPQRICLNLDFCGAASYAVGAPHALEQVPADTQL
jgi:hypothetical protein